MLLPYEVLAFAPAPVVWMNLDVHSRREGVVLVNVPAVPSWLQTIRAEALADERASKPSPAKAAAATLTRVFIGFFHLESENRVPRQQPTLWVPKKFLGCSKQLLAHILRPRN